MSQPVKYQGVDKESSGYKLLAAMGWQEGSGLVRLPRNLELVEVSTGRIEFCFPTGSKTARYKRACKG